MNMTELEFNEIISLFGIDDIIEKSIYEIQYKWNDLIIEYDKSSGHVNIEGLIPKSILNEIHNYLDKDIHKYVVDSKTIYQSLGKKEFLIFLLAMTNSNNIDNYQEILNKITVSCINKVDYDITNEEWLNTDLEDDGKYQYIISNEQGLDLKLRETLSNFDKAINPFLDKEIELKDPEEYVNKFKIQSSNTVRPKVDRLVRDNSAYLNIFDENRNEVYYSRGSADFNYHLVYRVRDDVVFYLEHSYMFGKEIIRFHVWDDDNDKVRKTTTFYYEMPDQTIVGYSGPTRKVRNYEKEMIIRRLISATEYAKEVTVNNMAKKNSVKKLTK